MSVDPHSDIPTREALALVIGFAGIGLPALVFWQYGGHALLGESPLFKLLGLTSFAGAIMGALLAPADTWRRAVIPGVVAGAGGPGLHVFYTTVFERTSLHTVELVMVCLLGAAPGFLLYKLFSLIGGESTKAGRRI